MHYKLLCVRTQVQAIAGCYPWRPAVGRRSGRRSPLRVQQREQCLAPPHTLLQCCLGFAQAHKVRDFSRVGRVCGSRVAVGGGLGRQSTRHADRAGAPCNTSTSLGACTRLLPSCPISQRLSCATLPRPTHRHAACLPLPGSCAAGPARPEPRPAGRHEWAAGAGRCGPWTGSAPSQPAGRSCGPSQSSFAAGHSACPCGKHKQQGCE